MAQMIIEAIGTGVVAALTFAFNPIPQFVGNALLASVVTIGLGFVVMKFVDGSIGKFLGAGVAIAGTIGLVTSFLGGQQSVAA